MATSPDYTRVRYKTEQRKRSSDLNSNITHHQLTVIYVYTHKWSVSFLFGMTTPANKLLQASKSLTKIMPTSFRTRFAKR